MKKQPNTNTPYEHYSMIEIDDEQMVKRSFLELVYIFAWVIDMRCIYSKIAAINAASVPSNYLTWVVCLGCVRMLCVTVFKEIWSCIGCVLGIEQLN